MSSTHKTSGTTGCSADTKVDVYTCAEGHHFYCDYLHLVEVTDGVGS